MVTKAQLLDEAWDTYEEATAPLLATYKEAKAPLWSAYEEAMARIRAMEE